MRIAHVLRKYDPSEWGGTETAVLRLISGLQQHGVSSSVFAPKCKEAFTHDPFAEAGIKMRSFRAFAPVLGLRADQKEQLMKVGGNIMSFQLYSQLMSERALNVIHTHALNRLGGLASMAARRLRVPLVVTVHGGVLDLPENVKEQLVEPLKGGFEWGKVLGFLLRSRNLLKDADAIVTCNPKEAAMLHRTHPHKRIMVLPHSVPASLFEVDHRAAALERFPMIADRDVLMCLARLDPVKNQSFLIDQLPETLRRHPRTLLVMAGASTSAAYERELHQQVERLGLQDHVLFTGNLEPCGQDVIGLMQSSRAVVLPSHSETFGLVILEAWAAGVPVTSSCTSGALSLITPDESGCLFDLDAPEEFHQGVDAIFGSPEFTRNLVANGRKTVLSTYDVSVMGQCMKELYDELIAFKAGRVAA